MCIRSKYDDVRRLYWDIHNILTQMHLLSTVYKESQRNSSVTWFEGI